MIRFWEQKDVIQLRKLIKALLENQHKHGSRILPSNNNVSYYLKLGYFQVQNGDPHLVYEEDGEILGYVQLGEVISELEYRGKTAEFFAMYTKPEVRGRFINIELIRELGLRAISRGFTHIISSVMCSNEKALRNFFHNPAIWPTSVNLEWYLAHDPQLENGELVKLTERKSA